MADGTEWASFELPRTAESMSARELRQEIERVADGLERLASHVRQCSFGVEGAGSSTDGAYVRIAADIQHYIAGALPNLLLSRLAIIAADADIARAKGL